MEEGVGRRSAASSASAVLMGLLVPIVASAQVGASVQGVAVNDVLHALHEECYYAGMLAETLDGPVVTCGAVLQQRSLARTDPTTEDAYGSVVSHKIAFVLAERPDGVRIGADSWMEIEEMGTVIEEPITSDEYLSRLEDVLVRVGERVRAASDPGTRPPWAGRYPSEDDWHLDAHLRAVNHCDRALAGLSAQSVGDQLESIGLRPLGDETRDLCEQLYQRVFEWGLARGVAAPTVEEYAEYRAALPPDERVCTGRLALDAACD